jgi:hypothetical protein
MDDPICRCCGILESKDDDERGFTSDNLCPDCYAEIEESGACWDCFSAVIQVSCEEWLCTNCDLAELEKLGYTKQQLGYQE